ncbi:CLUMA_CG008537, isoform A [Clunio marinus]|uniref:CLUMA_CG008537, isoform A n=1 Tax=Clunio marinus TaxID=568069 RepID=A0A1J1I7X3_9DIPT|nr:CLUMA_CG008537, isoform A [Clunio marinus]
MALKIALLPTPIIFYFNRNRFEVEALCVDTKPISETLRSGRTSKASLKPMSQNKHFWETFRIKISKQSSLDINQPKLTEQNFSISFKLSFNCIE